MQEIDFETLIKTVQSRRDALGITEAEDEACRNLGTRRTSEKRALLRRMSERCAEAGIAPLKANY